MANILSSPQLGLAKQIAAQYQIVIILIDHLGKINWASPSLQVEFGYQLSDVVGQPIFQFCPELSLMDIKRSIKTGQSIGKASYFIDRKGNTLEISLSKGLSNFGNNSSLCLLLEKGDAKIPLHEAIYYMGQYNADQKESPKLISIQKNKQAQLVFRNKKINATGSYKAIVDQAIQLADTDTCVLIQGEKGTGKKTIAKQIHQSSTRKNAPFLSFDCQTDADAMERQLFGYTEKGHQIEGILDQVKEGSLFLKNIHLLPLLVQDQILNTVLDRIFFRQGNKQPKACNIRIIASANCDLRSQIRSGLFHPALYRLFRNQIIYNPPLRERKEQIKPLLKSFLSYYHQDKAESIAEILMDESLINQFENHDYPDNIIELKTIVKATSKPEQALEKHPLFLLLKNKLISRTK